MAKRYQRQHPKKRHKKQSATSLLKKEIDNSLGIGEKKSVRKPSMRSRSYAPKSLAAYEALLQKQGIDSDEAVEEEEFFDIAIGTSSQSRPLIATPESPTRKAPLPREQPDMGSVPQKNSRSKIKKQQVSPQYASNRSSWAVNSRRRTRDNEDATDHGESSAAKPKKYRSWDKDGDNIPDFLEDMWDNSDRKAVGLGCLETIFGGGKDSVEDQKRDKRPFFTYWVTLIQLVIFIVVMATYGIAPIGFGTEQVEGEVLLPSLVTKLLTKEVKENLWIGPTQEDLIHLGAKYSPCMRPDSNIDDVLAIDREIENNTACCVNNDGSGCVQVQQGDCSTILSTWYEWNVGDMSNDNPGSRGSGSVCGQDPRYCHDVEPMLPSNWPDDITRWPVCVDPYNVTDTDPAFMTCDVVGRPCCYGIQGECMITTREHCEFEDGFFHDEATLCSQVKCIDEVCGMFGFANEEKPDQFYRFFTSLFLHSGILTMVITLIVQLLLMRDLEKMIGWLPMFFIYLGGGMVGGLASVIFLPYYVETGPTGAQMAVMGALFVEVMRWNNDDLTDKCGPAIGKIIAVVLILFCVGLCLVDVNNWSNFFGLFYGICVTLTFRPLKEIRGKDVSRGCWIATIVVCAILCVLVIIILAVIFYMLPITECEGCLYFNCIPFTPTYCDGLSVSIGRNASAQT